MNARWHDLTFDRLKDGGIHLEQQSGCEEPSVIHLHPEQVLSIARHLCGMQPETAKQVQELERRIAVLTDKLQNIVCDGGFRSDVLERTSDGLWYLSKLDAALDLALEYDGGRLEPETPPDAQNPPTASANASSKAKAPEMPAIKPSDDGQLGLAV